MLALARLLAALSELRIAGLRMAELAVPPVGEPAALRTVLATYLTAIAVAPIPVLAPVQLVLDTVELRGGTVQPPTVDDERDQDHEHHPDRQNEPLAPEAAQIPVQIRNATNPPPLCWRRRR